ncbi:MAG TPA: hypothetical protein VKR59_10595 [Terriglobales bacterium]|nr:hypothetical protein [Terriglobales bacterium]
MLRVMRAAPIKKIMGARQVIRAAPARVIRLAIGPQVRRPTAEETTRVVLRTRVPRAGPPIMVKIPEATEQETLAETVVATSPATAAAIPVATKVAIGAEIKVAIAEQTMPATMPGTAEARVTVPFLAARSL